MNSFQAIALTKNTSLAVVAPGIAEALFATALGLLAAIPAVVAYNKLSKGSGPLRRPHRNLRRRVLGHLVAPDGGSGLTMTAPLSSSLRGVRRLRTRPMSDINVTPMVDVMLVLLIIFMVTAPLLTIGVQVDLPKTQASLIPGEDEPLTVSVDAEGTIFLQETELDLAALAHASPPSPATIRTSAFSCAATRPSPTAASWRSWGRSTPPVSARWRWSPSCPAQGPRPRKKKKETSR